MFNANFRNLSIKIDLTTGQDDIKRRASSFNINRIDHLYPDLLEEDLPLVVHYGDSPTAPF